MVHDRIVTRVNVSCEEIPSSSRLDSLAEMVADAEDELQTAQEHYDEAGDALDDAQHKLDQMRAALDKAQSLESARDYVEADQAAIAALPVI